MDYSDIWDGGMQYSEYIGLIENLLEHGKSTSSDDPKLVEYSKLNIHRMNRVWKTTEVHDLQIQQSSKHNLRAIVISEGWCGDAAQTVPIIVKLFESLGIETRIVLRDQNLDLIDAHLTNGGRSIPKLLVFDSSFNLLTEWGPRPRAGQDYFLSLKSETNPPIEKDEISKQLQLWYTKDKGASTLNELVTLLNAQG